MDSKFKVGDKVTIIKYGARFWSYEKELGFPVLFHNEEEGYKVYDMYPELVGQTGIIDRVTKTQGQWLYALHGPNKTAWYDEQQLEKVLPAPKNKTARSGNPFKVKTGRAGR